MEGIMNASEEEVCDLIKLYIWKKICGENEKHGGKKETKDSKKKLQEAWKSGRKLPITKAKRQAIKLQANKLKDKTSSQENKEEAYIQDDTKRNENKQA